MSFDAKPLQIKSLFTKHIFTIPRNQRRYVWNKENWSELYEDLKFIIENKKGNAISGHFLGSFVLQKKKEDNDVTYFEIIDGQQRSITIVLFLAAIMQYFKEHDMKDFFDGCRDFLKVKDAVSKEHCVIETDYYDAIEKIVDNVCDWENRISDVNKFIKTISVGNINSKFADCFLYFYKLLQSQSKDFVWDVRRTLADAKYIVAKTDGLHLTARAKKSLQQCVINIREKNYIVYQNFNKDLIGCAFLCRTVGIDQRILTFHPDYQTNFKYEEDDAYVAALDAILEYDEDEEIELLKMLADPRTTLCQCLWFLMEKRKWKYPDKFSEETGLHKNYHGKIKNDKYNNMGKDVLMAICVALGLKLRLIEKIFDKSSQKLNEYQEPDRTYIHILENFPCISLDDFNGFLRVKNLKELGTTIKE